MAIATRDCPTGAPATAPALRSRAPSTDRSTRDHRRRGTRCTVHGFTWSSLTRRPCDSDGSCRVRAAQRCLGCFEVRTNLLPHLCCVYLQVRLDDREEEIWFAPAAEAFPRVPRSEFFPFPYRIAFENGVWINNMVPIVQVHRFQESVVQSIFGPWEISQQVASPTHHNVVQRRLSDQNW